MAKKQQYQDSEQEQGAHDEGFDEFVEQGSVREGHWRPPYGLIAVVCALFLVVGFGAGFGAGWGSKPDKALAPASVAAPVTANTTKNAEDVDIIRYFVPIDYEQNVNNDRIAQHYEQTSILNPAFHALSVVITTLGGTNNTYDPNVMRIYVLSKYKGSQDVLARLFNVAQRLQISPDFNAQLYELTTSMVDVFGYIRDNQGKIGTAGRRLLAANSAEPLAVQLLKAFVKSGLQSPVLQGALGDLSFIYGDLDSIVDLVVDLFYAVRGIAAEAKDIEDTQKDYHPSIEPPPPPQPIRVSGVNVTVLSYNERIAAEVDDDMVQDVPVGSSRRRLLQDNQISIPLPAGFKPDLPMNRPNLLIPTVWHILQYKNTDGSYGPPNVANACSMVDRMIAITNFRLKPSGFQLFNKECRSSPSYQYLVRPDRQSWINCASPGFFYDLLCGEVIQPSAVDFPRAINIYVVGEQPPTEWVGYAFAPGATDDPTYGHMALTWTSLSTEGVNNRANFESGASALVHEVMHHLGMSHTFGDGTCEDGDANTGVTDTPITNNPVWSQPWAQKAYLNCMNQWNKALASNWDTANRQASTRVGIPATDANSAFDSCPGTTGADETSNYITYTYDICLLAMGHLTTGQIAQMHQITADNNPTLYAWGQYFAQNPPPGALPVAVASPPPSPSPPSPSPPMAAPSPSPSPSPVPTPTPTGSSCVSGTQRACTCMGSWDYLGTTYRDCTIVPGQESKGNWCQVDRSNGNCANARNGWWDYCTPCSAGGAATPAPSPSPSPSPSPAPTTGGTPQCGAGAPTKSGLTCTSAAWKLKDSATTYTGCANPNKDVKGSWCVLVKGQATTAGAAWDYCLDGCNAATTAPTTTASGTTTYPYKKQCQRGFSGLPGTCTCSDNFSLSFQGYGTKYTGQRGCTMFEETGSGMCVTTCLAKADAKNNNKAFACDCKP